jgi:NAD(P)-dependent dehydrogenase (short-subunit alcohol dehydrogenase family)
MNLNGKTAIVTGGASGIGRATARLLAKGGAKVTVADRQADGARAVADEIGGFAAVCDVRSEAEIQAMVRAAEAKFGPTNIYFSNAGISSGGDENASNEDWQCNWDIHVMAHVYASRIVLPGMAARGGGHFILTASAAGLLTHTDSATYAVSKHATVAFAEWISIAWGDRGIHIAALCPQGVKTAMTAGREDNVFAIDGMIEAEPVAQMVVDAMADRRFLILPHASVAEYMKRKTDDYDRWLGGMRRLRAKYRGA